MALDRATLLSSRTQGPQILKEPRLESYKSSAVQGEFRCECSIHTNTHIIYRTMFFNKIAYFVAAVAAAASVGSASPVATVTPDAAVRTRFIS